MLLDNRWKCMKCGLNFLLGPMGRVRSSSCTFFQFSINIRERQLLICQWADISTLLVQTESSDYFQWEVEWLDPVTRSFDRASISFWDRKIVLNCVLVAIQWLCIMSCCDWLLQFIRYEHLVTLQCSFGISLFLVREPEHWLCGPCRSISALEMRFFAFSLLSNE